MEDDDDYDDELVYAARGELEIRERVIILRCLVEAAYDADRRRILAWLEKKNLLEAVAPTEWAYLRAKKPTEQQIINASWRTEALEALLWVVGELPNMTASSDTASLESIATVMPNFLQDCSEFLEKESMRDEAVIYDECEIIYNQHWAVRDDGRPGSNGLDPGVVREKHYALNWVLYSEAWDEVSTDT